MTFDNSVKTDTIFYRLFQSFPQIFFELIHLSPQLAQTYQFSSVEIKQLAFRIDGVFLPSVSTPEQPIYFVEVQFQPDSDFYSRFFAEIFLYLDKTELTNNWRGIVIFPRRSIDTGNTERYVELLNSRRISRIYLEELEETSEQSLGIPILKLVVADEQTAIAQGRELINKIRTQSNDERQQRELLQLIETILFYKLPNKNRQEIEMMFGLSDLKQTRVYQEALEEGREQGRTEGKLESVPRLLALGLNIEQIAEALGLDIEQVRKVVEQRSPESK